MNTEDMIQLEWANYAATARVAQVTPGLHVALRPDVIFTHSEVFPTPDVNHACLLRAAPETADALIAEVVDYFRSRQTPPTVFVSPACTPFDLPDRLMAVGFAPQPTSEAWMVLADLPHADVPTVSPHVVVRQIDPNEALMAAQVFMTAFEMPEDFAPLMAQLIEPSIGLPGIFHYLACVDGKPSGTCTLMCYETWGILGSAGVIPSLRGTRVATSLAAMAVQDALTQGVQTLMLQTAAGTLLERFLRIHGFRTAFIRTGYTLA